MQFSVCRERQNRIEFKEIDFAVCVERHHWRAPNKTGHNLCKCALYLFHANPLSKLIQIRNGLMLCIKPVASTHGVVKQQFMFSPQKILTSYERNGHEAIAEFPVLLIYTTLEPTI